MRRTAPTQLWTIPLHLRAIILNVLHFGRSFQNDFSNSVWIRIVPTVFDVNKLPLYRPNV